MAHRIYSPELAREILRRLTDGETLTADIYVLKCPDTGSIRYVGKAVDASKRLKGHLRDIRRRNTPLYRWLTTLVKDGKRPILEVIQRVPIIDWQIAEIKTIENFRKDGHDLLNIALGGDQPGRASYETLAENGRKSVIARTRTPRATRIFTLKRDLGRGMSWMEKNASADSLARFKETLRLAAQKNPIDFGCYANV